MGVQCLRGAKVAVTTGTFKGFVIIVDLFTFGLIVRILVGSRILQMLGLE